LGKLEFNGMAIDLEKIGRLRKRLSVRAERLNSTISRRIGRVVDVGSQDDLMTVMRETGGLRAYTGMRRVTMSILEELASREPIARHIVDLKRLRGRIGRLEAVYANVREGKVYPLFNQISSRVGVITGRPNVFGTEGLPELRSSFEREVGDLFIDPAKSLQALARITGDPVLRKATSKGSKRQARNMKLSSGPVVDQDELLLRLVIGQSDSELSRRFMVERLTIRGLRFDLEKKYKKMFQWLTRFRRVTLENGYAKKENLRKHIDGLKSSDMARRKQSTEYAVRWLIGY
jgi:DNA polymerase I-like protein with 3'-5' exonuclease and polymerase domains